MSEASSCLSTPAKFAMYFIFILVALASGYFYGIEDSIADNVNTSTVTIAGVPVIDKSDYKGASIVLSLALLLLYLYVVTQSDNKHMSLRIVIPLLVGAGSWIIGIFFGHMNSISDNKNLFNPAIGCLVIALLIILIIVMAKLKNKLRIAAVFLVLILLVASSIMFGMMKTQDAKSTKFDNTRYGLYATTVICLFILIGLIRMNKNDTPPLTPEQQEAKDNEFGFGESTNPFVSPSGSSVGSQPQL